MKQRTIHKQENKRPQSPKAVMLSLLLGLLLLSLGIGQGTLGKFLKAFIISDSATPATFDVLITIPNGFSPEQGKLVFDHRFLSSSEVKVLNLQAYNNGEVDVRCTPYVNGGIMHRIYVSGEECTEFVLKPMETVLFQLVLGANGLDENVKEAQLIVDIQQMEGE